MESTFKKNHVDCGYLRQLLNQVKKERPKLNLPSGLVSETPIPNELTMENGGLDYRAIYTTDEVPADLVQKISGFVKWLRSLPDYFTKEIDVCRYDDFQHLWYSLYLRWPNFVRFLAYQKKSYAAAFNYLPAGMKPCPISIREFMYFAPKRPRRAGAWWAEKTIRSWCDPYRALNTPASWHGVRDNLCFAHQAIKKFGMEEVAVRLAMAAKTLDIEIGDKLNLSFLRIEGTVATCRIYREFNIIFDYAFKGDSESNIVIHRASHAKLHYSHDRLPDMKQCHKLLLLEGRKKRWATRGIHTNSEMVHYRPQEFDFHQVNLFAKGEHETIAVSKFPIYTEGNDNVFILMKSWGNSSDIVVNNDYRHVFSVQTPNDAVSVHRRMLIAKAIHGEHGDYIAKFLWLNRNADVQQDPEAIEYHNVDGVLGVQEKEPYYIRHGVSVFRFWWCSFYDRWRVQNFVTGPGGRTYHALERVPRLAALLAIHAWKARLKAVKLAEKTEAEILLAIKAKGPASVIAYFKDSLEAGNCEAGTKSWLFRKGFSGRKVLPLSTIAKCADSPYVQAVIRRISHV